MIGTDDEDLKALRASSWALKELEFQLPRFLETVDGKKAEIAAEKASSSYLSEVLDLVSVILLLNSQS